MIRICIPLAVVLACVAPACSKDSATPTAPAPVARSTETFTGTVPTAGSAFHGFSVAQTGQVDVTLTSAGPPSTIVMGLGVGQPDGSTCRLFAGASTSAQPGTAPQLSGTISPGALCVEIRDNGSQTGPVTYTVTVTHP